MKTDGDDGNYEGMISRLAKGSMEDKAQALRKLLFLYENARSRIYLYERRITECLELCLLIEEKDICLNALSLLERIIYNSPSESDLAQIIKKRLFSKMVLNLGSIEVNIRKISHKCILEFLRKFRDLDILISMYLKTALNQAENSHLKLKAINSLHSLLMAETKYFSHQLDSAKSLLETLILASYQKEHGQVRRAGLICLLYILKINGVEDNLRNLSTQADNQLNQLKYENQELAELLDSILQISQNINDTEEGYENAPSPKFISIQQSTELKPSKQESMDIPQKLDKIPQNQLKIFNEVSVAEDFLHKLQTSTQWQIQEVEQYAPFLQKCLVQDSIKLFSVSKKIVEVIFNSEDDKKRQYYVLLVPCVVSGIGNKRFIVRKNLDKLVRHYVKNHTDLWVHNFVERMANSKNSKLKEMLVDLLFHAYRTSPQFYHPPQRTFQVFNLELLQAPATLKRKIVDCVLFIIERQAKDEQSRDEMLHIFSQDPYSKIIRKLGKPNKSIATISQDVDQVSIEQVSPMVTKKERKQRLITAQPQKINFIQKSIDKLENVSEEKYRPKAVVLYSRQKKARNSHIEISFKVKKPERRSKDEKEKTSIQRLPELKKAKNSSISKHEASESPVKRSMGQRNIVYVEKDNLRPLDNPKGDLEVALVEMKDQNWSIQFDGISKIRSIVEFHLQLLSQQTLSTIVGELLQTLSNLRSGLTKLALMCLNQMMRRLRKKMYQFTQQILLTIIRKSITTSQFMQDQIKRCILTSIEELCPSKIISALNSIRDSRSIDIRMALMQCLQAMIHTQKLYRREHEWIWSLLLHFHQQPQFNLRSQCKRLVKLILELYKDWKNDLTDLRKEMLQKIDKLLKTLCNKQQNTLWIQIENYEFQKKLLNKAITHKYFAIQYSKFQELDRTYTVKKNWKDRMKLLNELFQNAFEHPQEFQNSTHSKKYIQIAIEQIDDKNPGLLINTVTNILKSIDYFPQLLQETIGSILQKCVPVLQNRRGQIISIITKLLQKIYNKYDINKIMKQYLRLLVNNNKCKNEVVSQLLLLLKQQEQQRYIRQIPLQKNQLSTIDTLTPNCQNVFAKSIIKVCNEREITGGWGNRLKQLIAACQRRFGPEFSSKLMGNAKMMEILS